VLYQQRSFGLWANVSTACLRFLLVLAEANNCRPMLHSYTSANLQKRVNYGLSQPLPAAGNRGGCPCRCHSLMTSAAARA